MSETLAMVGMVVLGAIVLILVGAYFIPRLMLWLLALAAEHFLA